MKTVEIKSTRTAQRSRWSKILVRPEIREMLRDLALYFLLLSLIILSLLTTACKRSSDKSEIIGPELVPVSENFQVSGNAFSISSATPVFASTSVNFISTFNERVTWKITINGKLSGAQKILSGVSDALNAENSSWDGNSDNIYFFRKNELCVATLSFIGTAFTLGDSAVINTTKNYSGLATNGIRYTLIDDFDATSPAVVPVSAVSKDLFDSPVVMTKDTLVKVQGQSSFLMDGLDLNNNSWCGGINHTNLTEIKSAGKSPVTEDATDFYVNLYVYGTGKPNTTFEIKTYEVDDVNNLNKLPTPGYTYESLTNDAWVLDMPIDWKGWKLVSVKYSQFVPAKDPSTGGAGNRIREPHKITGLAVSLLSMPNSGANVSCYIDMITFTEGGPFVP